jgi:hypothetical protein
LEDFFRAEINPELIVTNLETGRREIAAWELGLLLQGIDLGKGWHRKRYSKTLDSYLRVAQNTGGIRLEFARRTPVWTIRRCSG